MNLSLVSIKKDEFWKSLNEYLPKAIQSNPNYDKGYYWVALCYYELDEFDQCQKHINIYIDKFGKGPEIV